jgi:putative endopeptidase
MSPHKISRSARRKVAKPLAAALTVAALTFGAISAVAPPANAIDATIIDTKADPRADFSRYAFGVWLDRTTIPADRPGYGTFDEVGDPLEANLLNIVQTPQSTADGQKMNGLFAQAVDTKSRNEVGLKPIQKTLKQIRAAKTKRQLAGAAGPAEPFESHRERVVGWRSDSWSRCS